MEATMNKKGALEYQQHMLAICLEEEKKANIEAKVNS